MCHAILLLTGAFYGRTRNDVKPLRNPGPENHKYENISIKKDLVLFAFLKSSVIRGAQKVYFSLPAVACGEA